MTALLKQSVLSIYIPKQGNVSQGKYCLINEKPCFVANMTEQKWFRNFGGYAISKRLLDKLPRGTQIIYKRIDLNAYYLANKSKFQNKGVLVNYGGHSQWVLPLKNWNVKKGHLQFEPKDLPVTDLEKWGKQETIEVPYAFRDRTKVYLAYKKFKEGLARNRQATEPNLSTAY